MCFWHVFCVQLSLDSNSLILGVTYFVNLQGFRQAKPSTIYSINYT